MKWLTPIKDSFIDDMDIYELNDDLYNKYEIIKLGDQGLLINNREDNMLKFAIAEAVSMDKGQIVHFQILFHGEGFLGLRECRHTWWGEDGKGYMFYPNADIIILAMHKLKDYFDMD